MKCTREIVCKINQLYNYIQQNARKDKCHKKTNECNDFNAVNKTATANIGWTITAKYTKVLKIRKLITPLNFSTIKRSVLDCKGFALHCNECDTDKLSKKCGLGRFQLNAMEKVAQNYIAMFFAPQ